METTKFLFKISGTDVEFVPADNSDDPAIIDGFMAALDDRRVISCGRSVHRCLNRRRGSPADLYRVVDGLLARPRDLIAELRTATNATVIARLAA